MTEEEITKDIEFQSHLILFLMEQLHNRAKDFKDSGFVVKPCCLPTALVINCSSALLMSMKINKEMEFAELVDSFINKQVKSNSRITLVGEEKDSWDDLISES